MLLGLLKLGHASHIVGSEATYESKWLYDTCCYVFDTTFVKLDTIRLDSVTMDLIDRVVVDTIEIDMELFKVDSTFRQDTLSFMVTDSVFVFDFYITIYRDRYQGGNIGAVDFDSDLSIAIYEINNGNFELDEQRRVYDVPIVKPDEILIQLKGNDCFDESVLSEFITDKSTYILRNITLDYSPEGYFLAYQRCCRSNSINNILIPNQVGSATELFISEQAQLEPNSTPVFINDPENVICVGFQQILDFEAFDADGDNLVYSFDAPITAGGSRGDNSLDPCPASDPLFICATECDGITPSVVNCRPDLFRQVEYEDGFSFDNPISADQAFTIDPMTGLVEGIANAIGVYVIAVKVEEYRNGVKIGEVRRDFNVNVTTCTQEAVIGPPGRSADIDAFKLQCNDVNQMVIDEWDPCGAALVSFQNYVDADPDQVTFRWTIFDQNGTTEQQRNDTDWNPSFDLPVGEYVTRFTLFPDLVCEDYCEMQLNVTPPLNTNFVLDLNSASQCEEAPIQITVPPIDPNASYSWDFGDGSVSNQHDPVQILYDLPGQYEIQLVAERGRCTDTTTIGPLDYFPLPSLVRALPSQYEACSATTISFENLTLSDPNPYTLEWDFDDGKSSTLVSPENTFDSPGTYQVSLKISSGASCSRTEIFPWAIDILPGPTASFSADPTEVTNPSQIVEFTNTSINASSYEWRFGDNSLPSFNQDASHQFMEPGVFEVELLAFSSINNCVNRAVLEIPVTAAGMPFFPNAFNPLDGQNSEFKAMSVFDNFEDFYLGVYNRWGELVFETKDFAEGWNGKKHNSGVDMPTGVYIYQFTFEVLVGSEREQGADRGTVFLLR